MSSPSSVKDTWSEVEEVRLNSCWYLERRPQALSDLRDELWLFPCRVSIKHEAFRDSVSARSLLFMGLLLDDPAEDVISGAAKPSDLCRYSYRITKWLNAGGGKERDEAMFLINSLRCCGRKQPLLLTFTFFQTHVCRGHKRPRWSCRMFKENHCSI